MFTIRVKDLKEVQPSSFTDTPAGESATLICTDGKIHSGIILLMPAYTQLVPLVSSGGECVYRVRTYDGFTVAKFVELCVMFASGQSEDAYRRLDELNPPDTANTSNSSWVGMPVSSESLLCDPTRYENPGGNCLVSAGVKSWTP